jgi:hypothetical protein
MQRASGRSDGPAPAAAGPDGTSARKWRPRPGSGPGVGKPGRFDPGKKKVFAKPKGPKKNRKDRNKGKPKS